MSGWEDRRWSRSVTGQTGGMQAMPEEPTDVRAGPNMAAVSGADRCLSPLRAAAPVTERV